MKQNGFLFFFLTILFLSLNSCINDGHKKIIVQDPNGFFREEYIVINDSVKDGVYLKFYGNGVLWDSCFYKNDTLQGIRKLFSDKGYLEIKENYKNGVLNGEYLVYYPNGKIKLRQYFDDGTMQDTSFAYYENGHIKEKVTFKYGLENGPFTEYYKNGKIHWKGTYLDGDNEQDTLYEYSEQGELLKKMMCYKGICFTIWTKEKGIIKRDKKEILNDIIETDEELVN